MADDQFEGRETRYNDNLGGVIGKFAVAVVEADSLAKDSHARRVIALAQRPNAEMEANVSILGQEEKLTTHISQPLLTLTDLRPAIIDNAELELDMTVSASNETSEDTKVDASAEGEGRIGWGPFSISVKVSASTSYGKSARRSSDYRSHTNAKLRMCQGEVPEGLALLVDAVNQTVATGLEINKGLALGKAQEIAQTPAPAAQ